MRSGELTRIPLLAEEGWRDTLIEAGAPGWREARARQGEASIEARRSVSAGLLLRLRPIGLALRATPSAPPLRSAQSPLLCEEGNVPDLKSRQKQESTNV